MVLGIGEGKIEIILEKTLFYPGEPMRGKARLSLSAPKKARALRLDLYHEVRTHTNRRHSKTERVNDYTCQLAGEKLYGSGEEYPFEFLAPNSLSPAFPDMPGNPVADAVKAFASSVMPAPRFFVSVSLDAPMELDISARVQIQVTPPSRSQ